MKDVIGVGGGATAAEAAIAAYKSLGDTPDSHSEFTFFAQLLRSASSLFKASRVELHLLDGASAPEYTLVNDEVTALPTSALDPTVRATCSNGELLWLGTNDAGPSLLIPISCRRACTLCHAQSHLTVGGSPSGRIDGVPEANTCSIRRSACACDAKQASPLRRRRSESVLDYQESYPFSATLQPVRPTTAYYQRNTAQKDCQRDCFGVCSCSRSIPLAILYVNPTVERISTVKREDNTSLSHAMTIAQPSATISPAAVANIKSLIKGNTNTIDVQEKSGPNTTFNAHTAARNATHNQINDLNEKHGFEYQTKKKNNRQYDCEEKGKIFSSLVGPLLNGVLEVRELRQENKQVEDFLALLAALEPDANIQSCLLGITSHVQKLMRAQAVNVYVVDRSQGVLKSVCAASGQSYSRALGKGFAGRCVRERRSVVCQNTENDERYEEEETIIDGDVYNIACEPLLGKSGDAVGVIEVINKTDLAWERADFLQADLSLLKTFSKNIGLKIESCHFFHNFKKPDAVTEADAAFKFAPVRKPSRLGEEGAIPEIDDESMSS